SPILPGATVTYTFKGIGLNDAGTNQQSAVLKFSGDNNRLNDTLLSSIITATSIGSYPISENFESPSTVLPYVETLSGSNQLWSLQTGSYSNPVQTQPLQPRSPGNQFYLFNSYSGATGSVSRLYSNCIQMPEITNPATPPITTISFWTSHDDLLSSNEDSVYLVVTADKGLTWTRVAGLARYDALQPTPVWKESIVDLSAYNGQTIQIGFEGVSKNGNSIGLDDINLNFAGPLSVKLLNFTARRNGKANSLQWTATTQLRMKGFIVERSTDGKNFKSLAEISATESAVTAQSYSYADLYPEKGTNYYRLRIVENSSFYKYSQIRNIKNTGLAELIVTPNPVPSSMKLLIDAEKNERAMLVLTDLGGKKIFTRTINVVAGSNVIEIPMNQVSRGSYILSIQLESETINTKINKL
ncbi:MAG: T9SS type A sorting domain-containing protein, partial [Ferruginibacter sp.]|nr:T9SS type A sorting domain-containing protein [Ferruginibacter sp.]